MPEVFSWPEATLYLSTAGGTPSAMVFADNVRLDVAQDIERRGVPGLANGYVGRVRQAYLGRNCTLSFQQAWCSQESVKMLQSATAMNVAVSGSAQGGLTQTAGFLLWSAAWDSYGLGNGQGGIWQQTIRLQAPNFSAA